MAYLAKAWKTELLEICEEIGVEIDSSSRVPDIKDSILNSESYVEEEVKIILERIIENRKEEIRKEERKREEEIRKEEREERIRKEEREERIRLETLRCELEMKRLELSKEDLSNSQPNESRRLESSPRISLTNYSSIR